MSARDHRSYREDVGAYLLGALTDDERRDFEGHLAACAECRDEIERLRPAPDALPRSVEQLEPPSTLKASLMEVVESEAEPEPTPRRSRRSLGDLFGGLRPVLVAGVLALGALAGFGVAQLGGGDESRSVVASVDESRIPDASARLEVQGDGENGAILRVKGMPSPGAGRVYQAWVQKDGTTTPQPTFEVGADGSGAVAVPEDVSDAQAVLVTREPRGGARAPSEMPVLTVDL